ncbi:MAG: ubiquinone-binding protein [Betaproteobacteria bacterium RIFCSPLOWO2_02_FULL_67_26]|nr:MAG: ubiquinone-binding protein [Betaproteobacteria bacterium RIFCSPLOWO2_02_FULL_67_26]
MTDVNRSVLVAFTPAQMFALVEGVEDYPRFLPWCGGASVQRHDAGRATATIQINYRGIRQSFTTENALRVPETIDMRLVEGPFSSLDGSWRFTGLGDRGCKVELKLHYEFSSRVLEKLVGPVFNYITDRLVDAFAKRAEQVYG